MGSILVQVCVNKNEVWTAMHDSNLIVVFVFLGFFLKAVNLLLFLMNIKT